MKIEVSAADCVSSGQCVLVADDLFDQDDDGVVAVLAAQVGPERADAARRAASLCPARAITLTE